MREELIDCSAQAWRQCPGGHVLRGLAFATPGLLIPDPDLAQGQRVVPPERVQQLRTRSATASSATRGKGRAGWSDQVTSRVKGRPAVISARGFH